MAKLTAEQIAQKKQLLEEKMKEVKALYDELVEAGAIELSDDALDQAAGGLLPGEVSYRPHTPVPHIHSEY